MRPFPASHKITLISLFFFFLFLFRVYLSCAQKQSCSVCDTTQLRTTRIRNCIKTRHTHHSCYHTHRHRRNRVIKQNKRCTFAATTTEIPNPNELISEENQHMSFKSQSSNSSNASSIRIME